VATFRETPAAALEKGFRNEGHDPPARPKPGRPLPAVQPLIVLENVSKSVGELQVLREINLVLRRGEVLVIIGPSGGGKSTLCRTINRLEPIDSGAVFFDGKPIPVEGSELARHRSDVGMVFQSFNLFAHKTILQNVTLGPVNVRGIAKAEAAAQAIGLLERVGIEDQADKYPAQLSGGKQRRAAIARPRS
jgi:glutamate transport system ATP-binding protein